MKWFKRLVPFLLIIFALVVYFNYPKLNIITGYASKNMASSVFIAKRSSSAITAHDNNMPLIKLTKVESEPMKATASLFGLMERKTVCHEGLGCFVVNDKYDASRRYTLPKRTSIPNGLPFPYGNNGLKDTVFKNVDYALLEKAIEKVFALPETQKTRTVLVAYKNQIIGERYADGFTQNTPILGWSMTKSVLATLYGILEYQGKLKLENKAPVVAWQEDERKNITLNNLLRMQSGLKWEEDYSKISDVTRMLFLDADMSTAQIHKEALAVPGKIWKYSSGTTNLLSGILRKQFNDDQEYLDFPYTELIDKIGMHSMLIETDMEENFVGSSYGWANTRDWAKFGLLYLNKGQWNGQQLFSPEWVDYVTRPTDGSNGTYGAHFWLNAQRKYPDVPNDMYSANGFQGQRAFIIPSKDLVVVRTGLAESPNFDINQFLKDVLSAIQ